MTERSLEVIQDAHLKVANSSRLETDASSGPSSGEVIFIIADTCLAILGWRLGLSNYHATPRDNVKHKCLEERVEEVVAICRFVFRCWVSRPEHPDCSTDANGALQDPVVSLHPYYRESVDLAICDAASNLDVSSVQRQLESGKKANVTDNDGNSPLHLCMMLGPGKERLRGNMKEIAELLLSHAANPNAVDAYGLTPLMHLCYANLVAEGDPRSLYHYKYRYLDLWTSKRALERSIIQNTIPRWFYDGPFTWEWQEGYSAVARLLVERGADPNCTDRDSKTPLHVTMLSYRSEKRDFELLSTLLELGADPDYPDKNGQRPVTLNGEDIYGLVKRGIDLTPEAWEQLDQWRIGGVPSRVPERRSRGRTHSMPGKAKPCGSGCLTDRCHQEACAASLVLRRRRVHMSIGDWI